MLNVTPTNGPMRLAPPIPGVPDSQARALDRRRRLHSQLQSFRAIDRGEATENTTPITGQAELAPE